MLPPRLLTACSALHLAGRRSPEASQLSPVQTCAIRFRAAGSSPEGAAAPADWQSQIRGPCLKGMRHLGVSPLLSRRLEASWQEGWRP